MHPKQLKAYQELGYKYDEPPRTFGEIERDDCPTFAAVKIPFGEKHLLVPAFRFADGSVSRAMLTEKEWKALSNDARARLTIDPSFVSKEFP